MVKIVHDELVKLMGPVDTRIYFVSPGPTVILLAGLQGSGKTTTAAKLAQYLIAKGKKPCLAADDLQRPAAIDQARNARKPNRGACLYRTRHLRMPSRLPARVSSMPARTVPAMLRCLIRPAVFILMKK